MAEQGEDLAVVIAALRQQLETARAHGNKVGSTIRFDLQEIEVELSTQVETALDPKLGVRFWVVTADLGAKISSASVQKIKLKMKIAGENTKESDKIGQVGNR